MALDANEIVKGILDQLSDQCSKQSFRLDQPIEYTATNITRLNFEAAIQIDRLVQSRDISVDMISHSISLGKDIPLDVLSLIPLKYPEMVDILKREGYYVYQNGKMIGTVTYNGPAESNPDKGYIGIGYKANFNFSTPVQYMSLDLQVKKESQDE